jgi:MtN3 and saliva related transmembrane protein
MLAESIGWISSVVLLLTIGRQVYTQWRTRSTSGLSRWLFVGQVTASLGFTLYSVLVNNWVFVFTNAVLVVTAVVGQCIYLRNKHSETSNDAKP